MTSAGHECAYEIAREYDGVEKMFSDMVGASVNYTYVKCPGKAAEEYVSPYEVMVDALCSFTGTQPYKYRAFELLVTLDLKVYKAVRRIVVPADLEFAQLHKVLQTVFVGGIATYMIFASLMTRSTFQLPGSFLFKKTFVMMKPLF